MRHTAFLKSALASAVLAGSICLAQPAPAQTGTGTGTGTAPAPAPTATQNPGTNPGTANPGFTNPGTVNPGFTNPGTFNPGFTNPTDPFTNPFFPNPFFAPTAPFMTPANSVVPGATNLFPTTTGNGLPNGTGVGNQGFFLPGSPFGADNMFFNPFFTGFGSPFGVTNVTPNAGTVLGPAGVVSPLPGPRGPTLGINTVPHTAGGGPVQFERTAGAFVAPLPLNNGGQVPGPAGTGTPPVVTAVPGSRLPVTRTTTTTGAITVTGTTTAAAQPNPTSVHIARRLEAMMRNQAMITGHLVKVGATAAVVRIVRNGKPVSRRYALTDVFFFSGDDVFDAATAPSRLHAGDAVLVPETAGKPV
jgi:hypothetical protein